ncbi:MULTISPECIES: RNA polymerase recycling motor HelD [Pontibacillus]|uniref:RNA polymerase recycling motor HelD n=1 Tax=Pontibacillus chungwhensis TaxID=265426 RepID=A0ABY8V2F0_9BACI|nr:RNA polymerase recycling motor HelD [Pontibacillus chungwhensis]MCD5325709.1 UvrD-helicase domain-containing protein [Pontibacillus sp. HN14]WIF98051.1 RNA polymerase recycling motor HelD [Pontibacillus chungwhensis]
MDERQREQERVDKVVQEIEQKVEDIQEKAGDVKEEVIGLRETFWEDVTVNIDEPDDIMETYNSLRQQAELLGERERSHKHVYDQLKTLKRMKSSPYFGRVDFTEARSQETDQVYIGISSLMDRQDENFLVYDWRAPISSLYYDYSPGPAEYDTPEGTIEGTMDVKRQYIIRQGEIKGMFDTGVTIGDELLQEVLGNQANTQMKSIVATIQKEQNQIIRYDQRPFLVVQGVAGSGKTSAALQRVAYLLYRYRTKITADQMMLFSPNPMFNSYVANVLPELGEENIAQTTFQEYMEDRLQTRLQYEDAYDQLEYLLTAERNETYETRLEGVQYKATLQFKEDVDHYADSLAKKGLAFKNIKFRGEIIVSKEEIENHFYTLDPFISIPNRLEEVVNWLLSEIEAMEKRERSKEWVEEEIELLGKEEYLKIHQKLQAGYRGNAETFDDAVLEQKLLSKAIVKKYTKPIKRKIHDLQFLNMKTIYKSLFQSRTGLSKEAANQTTDQLEHGTLFYEDVTPFLYLEDLIKGTHIYNHIRYLFIDEAQDYSPFQFAFLKKLFPYSRMTVLGDYNQAIYAHTLHAPNLLSEDLYEANRAEYLTLLRSYRSTRQIIEFTKQLIPGGESIQPFNREGVMPLLVSTATQEEHQHSLIKELYRLGEKKYETIAIICKTAEESQKAYDVLVSKDIPVRLMDKDTYTFTKGIIVIPVYLAKGIEFDAVLLHDASDENYQFQLDRHLFYTACTRAMHELSLLTLGEPSRFIREISTDYYKYK